MTIRSRCLTSLHTSVTTSRPCGACASCTPVSYTHLDVYKRQLHRNLSISDQAEMADRVKRSEAGMITNPVTTTVDATVAAVDEAIGAQNALESDWFSVLDSAEQAQLQDMLERVLTRICLLYPSRCV